MCGSTPRIAHCTIPSPPICRRLTLAFARYRIFWGMPNWGPPASMPGCAIPAYGGLEASEPEHIQGSTMHVAIARMVQLRQQELAGSPGHTIACIVTWLHTESKCASRPTATSSDVPHPAGCLVIYKTTAAQLYFPGAFGACAFFQSE